ncbi:MAG: UvrD-helicase domain-containing protein [Bacteriovoracaceae bacterium]
MSRAPNSEQLLAIEHQGGVLLKAGAGSGKTFVLVEHIAYLTSEWIREAGHKDNFEQFIKERFSKVVMTTFTNKAAGEMKLRLYKRFDELVDENPGNKAWVTAREFLTWMTVTTIDGFCRKLIASGYFPHLSTSAEIIFDEQRSRQVERILEAWFAENSGSNSPFWDQLIRSKDDIRNSFCRIFNDPSKRMKWKLFSEDSFSDEKINELIQTFYKINNIQDLISVLANYEIPVDANAYEKGLVERFQRMGLPEIKCTNTLSLYQHECAQRAPSLTAKIKTPELEEVSEAYKKLKKWVKDLSEIITDYYEHRDDKIIPWFKVLYEIYQYVDARLTPNEGFTFGDIAYYVSLGLDNDEMRARVNNDYGYFIVDEFQDTSFLQFDIIKKLINNDFKKLFCVGDAKQAIYGFRGGELAVFKDCENMIPLNLELSHNYRSLAEIVEANNSAFDHILPIGFNFSSNDPYTVEFKAQTLPPIEYNGVGEIIINDLDLSHMDIEKISNAQLDAVEAKMIADQVETLRRQYPDKQNTILYKKLDPSTDLIRHLMNKRIGFTAQFKIELMDDPILGIFYTLIKRIFDRNEESKDVFPLSLINNYLHVLGVKTVCHVDLLHKFEKDVSFFGILEAYKKFLFSLHVTNENADLNLSYIDLLCLLYEQNLSAIFGRFKQIAGTKISMDLRWGDHSDKVVIMSAHASKGLEFDHVIIGGIFTNAADIPNRNLMGDNPQSFYWFKNFEEKEKVVTPFYNLDREVDKYKAYSESKRLLYVACTRAVEKLIWCSIDIGELNSKIKENTWSALFNDWQRKTSYNSLRVNKLDSKEYEGIIEEEISTTLPLFYYDNVGIHNKLSDSNELVIVPELSVTRLNSLLECPRKFYLENVLKLNTFTDKTGYKGAEDTEDELSNILKSSAERGTNIHEAISVALAKNFVPGREYINHPDEKIISQTLDRLKELSTHYELISEVPIKFSFFGHVISGIPDLILKPKSEGNYQVWDFKTGRITSEKLAPYWLQLKIYAYALYELKQVPKDNSIELELYFVDEQKSLSKKVSFAEIVPELFNFWQRQSRPWERNLDHCGRCVHGDICLK